MISVDGLDVQTFEYPDRAAAEVDVVLVGPDGGSVGTSMVGWMATPHFYHVEKLIVLYVGDAAAVMALLVGAVGPQFAGG